MMYRACMYIVDTYTVGCVCVCVLSVEVRMCVKYSGEETVCVKCRR